MTNQVEWLGDDARGFAGIVSGIQLYEIRTVLQPPAAPGPRRKDKYLYLTRRLNARAVTRVLATRRILPRKPRRTARLTMLTTVVASLFTKFLTMRRAMAGAQHENPRRRLRDRRRRACQRGEVRYDH